ncbi:hypothetical protein A9Q96_09760 [Rhodobacterales bacterium 52_120_T64]|nr:hypothetical protein A9Q96_09760 [Rhodobacterales bacterium 52_120_T64]
MKLNLRYAKYIALAVTASIILSAVGLLIFASYETKKHLAQTTAGSKLYSQNCASCHGVNLEGQPNWRERKSDGSLPAPPHNEDGHTWHHSDQLLFDYTKLGGSAALALSGVTGFNSGMPAFAEVLSDSEIISVLEFIKSTWPERAKISQQERSKAEEEASK